MVLVAKKSLKFEENSKINIYSLVPQNDHPVALWDGFNAYNPLILIINAKLGGFVNYFVFLGVHTASK